MIIRFGLQLDEHVFPAVTEAQLTLGESTFLPWIERQLGLQYHQKQDHLRIEQYRQALLIYLESDEHAFFAESFAADSLATADTLLTMRDELILAGWNFAIQTKMPTRLKALAILEQIVEQEDLLDWGFAERFRQVERVLPQRPTALQRVWYNEPLEDLPLHWQRLFALLQTQGVEFCALSATPAASVEPATDLQYLQAYIQQQIPAKSSPTLRADGSLIVLRAKRESDAALFISKIINQNADFQPVCMISKKNRALDMALIQEGLPSLGIMAASLARPTLQLLKLASAFLWRPINPYKLLEFVSLPNKPFHDGLARDLAAVLARKPGLFSDVWRGTVAGFYNRLEAAAEANPSKADEILEEKKQAETHYNFWFNRRRYDSNRERVPARVVADLFAYIQTWASEQIDRLKERVKKIDERIEKLSYRQDKQQAIAELNQQREDLLQTQTPLLNLVEQTQRLIQVLDTLPRNDNELTPLQLERLIRTLNEPAPMSFRPVEVGSLSYICEPSAIVEPTETLLWWNFIQPEHTLLFTRWYPSELHYLAALSVALEMPARQHQRRLWQQKRPIIQTQKRLVLVVPEAVEGRNVEPHPLWGDMQALYGKQLKNITIQIENYFQQAAELPSTYHWLGKFWKLPAYESLPLAVFAQPQPYLELQHAEILQPREEESFSSLQSLFYSPYEWVFKHKIDLRKSSILSVAGDETLKGNLAHGILNELFGLLKDAPQAWTQREVDMWLESKIAEYIDNEAATLNLYGKEPERMEFGNRLRYAAWALISTIQDNGWTIHATEMEVAGTLAGQAIVGIADLVLKRGQELAVLDLKWSGANPWRELMKNKSDLQLVIYSKLIATEAMEWAHTAYFSMQDAKLVARNKLAFRQAEAVAADENYKMIHQRIWEQMEATYRWRMEQIQAGFVELRSPQNEDEQPPIPVPDFTSLLEVHKRENRFDIYKVLINPIQ